MHGAGTCSRICCFLVVVLLAPLSTARSQDLFSEMSRVKSDLAVLKSEVNDLKRLVLELRNVVLEQVMATADQTGGRTGVSDRSEDAKPPTPAEEEQITKTACRAVGQFFEEAESALRMSDSSRATTKMNEALKKLTSALKDYSRTHRVSKLVGIYEGLAWNTYTAVQLRESVTGNADFLEKLRKHKQRYLETCPK